MICGLILIIFSINISLNKVDEEGLIFGLIIIIFSIVVFLDKVNEEGLIFGIIIIIFSIVIFLNKVDEEGSEAAALTGIILDIRTARVPQVITVDR